jgi:hypothetical protein
LQNLSPAFSHLRDFVGEKRRARSLDHGPEAELYPVLGQNSFALLEHRLGHLAEETFLVLELLNCADQRYLRA